jgi:hypothetical protein
MIRAWVRGMLHRILASPFVGTGKRIKVDTLQQNAATVTTFCNQNGSLIIYMFWRLLVGTRNFHAVLTTWRRSKSDKM